MFRRTSHLSLFRVRQIQSIFPHGGSLKWVLLLSVHQRLYLPKPPFLSSFPPKHLNTFPICATRLYSTQPSPQISLRLLWVDISYPTKVPVNSLRLPGRWSYLGLQDWNSLFHANNAQESSDAGRLAMLSHARQDSNSSKAFCYVGKRTMI
jgi:hypothetical protein